MAKSPQLLCLPTNSSDKALQWPSSYTESMFLHKTVKGQLKEGNVLFKDALNTFYLRLYGIWHMIKDHSDSESGNLLLPLHLLFFFY